MIRKKKKFKVLDLFAGAGGFGLGFQMADNRFKLIGSLEIDDWAVRTLKANNGKKQKIIHEDIRRFTNQHQIIDVCPRRPDIIIGGPPCQGFSHAGSRDPNDPRNSLFKNFAEWVDVLKPSVFVMENVKGIMIRKNEKGEKVIDIIKQTFEKIGYKVEVWILNAANYGVPQNRERVFIIGNNLNAVIPKPPITHYLPEEKAKLNGYAKKLHPAITVSKAISDLPRLNAGEGFEKSSFTNKPKSTYQKMCRQNSPFLYNHVTMAHTSRMVSRYQQILNGVSVQQLSHELKVRKRNGKGELSQIAYNQNYRHLKPHKVSFTIPASFYSNFIHPRQPRNITSREAARLQSFPDSYVFKGKRTLLSSKLLKKLGKHHENYLSQYNQIGNAVPPLLAKAVAIGVYKFLDEMQRKSAKSKNSKVRIMQQVA